MPLDAIVSSTGRSDSGRSRSTTNSSSTNLPARAIRAPSFATTSESPSNTSSSWPPTWLTYTTAQPVSIARRRISS